MRTDQVFLLYTVSGRSRCVSIRFGYVIVSVRFGLAIVFFRFDAVRPAFLFIIFYLGQAARPPTTTSKLMGFPGRAEVLAWGRKQVVLASGRKQGGLVVCRMAVVQFDSVRILTVHAVRAVRKKKRFVRFAAILCMLTPLPSAHSMS